MKKLFFCFLLEPFFCFSQYENPERVLKISLSSLPFNGYTLQYEKVTSKRISFGIGASYRPKLLIPYGEIVDKVVKKYGVSISGISFENVDIQNAKEQNFSITPEIRFYLSQKEAPYGMYLSLFAKANFYDMDVPTSMSFPYQGANVIVTLPVNFTINTFSGGLMLGYQIKLSRTFAVDLYALGGHFGISKIHGKSDQDLSILSAEQKETLRLRIIDSFNISDKYFDVNVNSAGAIINQTGNVPFVGLRMLGVNLGVTF